MDVLEVVLSHVALGLEVKTGGGEESAVLLRRVPCSCGWRGCWYATATAAEESYVRHARRGR